MSQIFDRDTNLPTSNTSVHLSTEFVQVAMSLSQISGRASSTAMNDLKDEKSQPYQYDRMVDTAIMVAELAKQLKIEQQSIQSQLQSIDILQKTCGKLLSTLQTLKESLTSCSSGSIQQRHAISLVTVE